LTTLTREATPLLRFRTGDLTAFTSEECVCGRTIGRMGRVFGRADDMLKVRGVKFWPSTVEHALLKVEGASENYEIIVERSADLDTMTVKVEPSKELYESVNGDLSRLKDLSPEIAGSIKSVAGVKSKVVLVPHGSLQRFMGKAKRVIDRRKKPV
ncbi:MAG: phenylacetate--CoA ligase, partial [Candidatus Bathyarchaeota archaeon]|nr:phenylacetate--CoA ligase [Candidatus Bathyarchaeota archaeon]